MWYQLTKRLILWMVHRRSFCYGPEGKDKRPFSQRTITFTDKFLFRRFSPFWWDESHYKHCKTSELVRSHRPPWYRPFNILLHWWYAEVGTQEDWHDHPRWSITICLKGEMIEHTPWKSRRLRPGSIVIRSRKYIHAFEMLPGQRGKVWTLFIVGRRNHPQNTYVITRQPSA